MLNPESTNYLKAIDVRPEKVRVRRSQAEMYKEEEQNQRLRTNIGNLRDSLGTNYLNKQGFS